MQSMQNAAGDTTEGDHWVRCGHRLLGGDGISWQDALFHTCPIPLHKTGNRFTERDFSSSF